MRTLPSLQTKLQTRVSFTLVEVIIAITLFSMLSIAGMVIWQDILKTYKKIQMEKYLSTETTALLERIARTVQSSGLDYEEYYSIAVIGTTTAGENYGEYHKQFFNPGTDGDYGAYCLGGITVYDNGCPTGSVADTSTFDIDTGQHPYAGSGMNANEANAMCDAVYGGTDCTTTIDYHNVGGLILLNASGTERTYFVLEGGDVPRVSMVELDGTDSDNDGLIDTWVCDEKYTCTVSGSGGNLPDTADIETVDGVDNDDFFPISSRHLYIDELLFYISPIEDPFKGYGETDATVFENVQLHPRVTIRITAHFQMFDDSDNPVDFEDYAGLVGESPTITLQTTVSTGNTEEIPGYTFP